MFSSKIRIQSRAFPLLYFFFSLLLLTILYRILYRGYAGGDGHYYYSYTVSLLWDGDLKLNNQYDHPLPGSKGTVTNGVYFIDHKTGNAFSFFNPGTGFFMLPTTFAARMKNHLEGMPSPDPFDRKFQFYAHYSAVIVTSLSLLFFFLVLRQFYSPETAAAAPFLFLFGTNWLFYATVLPNWSHTYSLFCNIGLIWAFLNLQKKDNLLYAALFGLFGGLGYSTRNFNILLLISLGLLWAGHLIGHRKAAFKKKVLLLGLAAFFAIAGAMPQFIVKHVQHGHAFASSYTAGQHAEKTYSFIKDENWVEGLVFSNLDLLYTTLFNRENGLFYCHPLFLIGMIGIALLRHRNREFQNVLNSLLLVLFIFWFTDTAYHDTWFVRAAGSGFGHRRYVDILPVFLFGAAGLFDFFASKRFLKYLLIFLLSLMTTAGIFLLYVFLSDYPSLYFHRDSFFGLHSFLLKRPVPLLSIALMTFLLIWFFNKSSKTGQLTWRKKSFIAFFLLAALIPRFIFTSDSSFLRKKHFLRDGFFAIYTMNPFVRLAAKEWALPEGGGRLLLTSEAGITLPAPLQEGDRIFFKLKPLFPPAGTDTMTVFTGAELVGETALKEGMRIYEFPLKFNPRQPRNIRIKIKTERKNPPYALIQEGRILYGEKNRRILEGIYGLDIRQDDIILEGWCLDDHRITYIGLYAAEPSHPPAVFLGKARRNPNTLTEHPDLDSTFVLYPELESAAFECRVPIPESLRGKTVDFWVKYVSEDGEEKKSRVISKDVPAADYSSERHSAKN